jgi:hypothetical protein
MKWEIYFRFQLSAISLAMADNYRLRGEHAVYDLHIEGFWPCSDNWIDMKDATQSHRRRRVTSQGNDKGFPAIPARGFSAITPY